MTRPQAFKPGNTYGKGRPVGSRNKAQLAIEKIGQDNAEAVYQKVVESALAGDMIAAKCILDRVVPIRKGTRVFIGDQLENKTIAQLDEIAQKVTTMMTAGQISAEEALSICSVLKYRENNIEMRELEVKLKEIKNRLDAHKKNLNH